MNSKGRLSVEDRCQILRWAKQEHKEMQLLYSFTKDGPSASTFHTKCNYKGPTVTVIYNTQGSIYGGYTSQHWEGTGAYKFDDQAFLFSLWLSHQKNYTKFPNKSPTYAIYCASSYGPIFGSGHDLCTFSNNLSLQGTTYTLNGSVSLGTSFEMLNKTAVDVTNNILTVTELEVYQMTDIEGVQWRKVPELNREFLESLKEEVEEFSPPEEFGVSRCNILLVGQVGAGKSSFFNNVDSVFRGHLTQRACSGNAENSVTLKFRTYEVRSGTTRKPLGFRLCDTRGLEESQGLSPQDMMFLVDGHVTDGYVFNPSMQISPEMVKVPQEKECSLNDTIHVVCLVVDASTVEVMPAKVLEKMKSVQNLLRQKDIPYMVLLTKTDKILPAVEHDVSKIFKSSTIADVVESVSTLLGIQRNHVLPMKNYESEVDVADDINALTLFNLRQMLRASEDCISDKFHSLSFDSVGSKQK